MLTLVVLSIISGVWFYVEAIKSGLNPKSWGLAGLAMGPAVLPLFAISRHVRLRKDMGFNNLYFRA